MAIQAFGLSIDPSMCRLYIDDDSDLTHIPRMLEFVFIQKLIFLY
jgi:hypothetical protein